MVKCEELVDDLGYDETGHIAADLFTPKSVSSWNAVEHRTPKDRRTFICRFTSVRICAKFNFRTFNGILKQRVSDLSNVCVANRFCTEIPKSAERHVSVVSLCVASRFFFFEKSGKS